MSSVIPRRVVCLSGGVGGARLAHGLSRALNAGKLTVVVNTGDDFTHFGLSISPDLDTVMYTLADLADVERGWGLLGDTWNALEGMRRYGAETWFALGDRDLATHVLRTQWLNEGMTLTEVTQRLCRSLGVTTHVLPMSDDTCETWVDTENGALPFQRWLVQERAEFDALRVFSRQPADATAAALRALEAVDLVIIGPSNPYVSIDPILALPGVRELLAARVTIAMSPIVHGKAVKGPLARMLQTLGNATPGPRAIADHYGKLVRAMVVERGDEAELSGMPTLATQTVMHTREDSLRVATELLAFAQTLPAPP